MWFLGHLSNSGDLLPWVGARCLSSIVRRTLTSSSQELLGQSYFMTNWVGVLLLGRGHISHIWVKMYYFFKNLLLYSGAKVKQTKYILMMTKEGSTKIVNFTTPGAGVLMLGRGHISHYSEYVLSSILSIYSHWLLLCWGITVLFLIPS